MLDFGEVWEQRLVRLIQEGAGIKSISKLLKADIATIKKYAEKNNVLDKWKPSRGYIPLKKSESTINKVNHYDLWVNKIKENPHLNKKGIRALIPATYIWLYRHDKQFLMENNPTSLFQPKKQEVKVDWVVRDTELLQKVIIIVQNWDKENKKPQRKTKTSIGKKTQKIHWLEKYPSFFPETLGYIESVVESIENFQIRRVKWILDNEFINRQVKEWQLYRRAGLRADVPLKLKKFIKDEVNAHNIKFSKIVPHKLKL